MSLCIPVAFQRSSVIHLDVGRLSCATVDGRPGIPVVLRSAAAASASAAPNDPHHYEPILSYAMEQGRARIFVRDSPAASDPHGSPVPGRFSYAGVERQRFPNRRDPPPPPPPPHHARVMNPMMKHIPSTNSSLTSMGASSSMTRF